MKFQVAHRTTCTLPGSKGQPKPFLRGGRAKGHVLGFCFPFPCVVAQPLTCRFCEDGPGCALGRMGAQEICPLMHTCALVWGEILFLGFTCSEASGMILFLFEPQFPYVSNADNSFFLIGVSVSMSAKRRAQCQLLAEPRAVPQLPLPWLLSPAETPPLLPAAMLS